jgi:hypothetical protein
MTSNREIGFIHLPAAVMAGKHIPGVGTFYTAEVQRTETALKARTEIGRLPAGSKEYVIKLIAQDINDWWANSHYAVSILKKIEEILNVTEVEITNINGVKILRKGNFARRQFNFLVSGMAEYEFTNLKSKLTQIWPNLVIYSEIVDVLRPVMI